MIYLINSNNYIGGGETIFSRLALYLLKKNIPFKLICCKDSFLESFALNNNIPHEGYIINQDNHSAGQFNISVKSGSQVFLCNLKDLYNLKLSEDDKSLKLAYLYYHPEDYQYLSIWKILRPKKISQLNLNNLNLLNSSKSLFVPSARYYQHLQFKNQFLDKAIPGFPSINIKKNPKEVKKVLCISRFVLFKTGSILGLFLLIRKYKHLECVIVGYGIFKFILVFWAKIMGINSRIFFAGKAEPSHINKYIDDSDFCFAQGTSLMQCISRGKPTIIQSYSSAISMLFPSYKSADIWRSSSSTFGEFYDLKKHSIYDLYSELNKNYKILVSKSMRACEELSEENVFEFILEKLEHASSIDLRKINVPKVPFLKKLYIKIKGLKNASL